MRLLVLWRWLRPEKPSKPKPPKHEAVTLTIKVGPVEEQPDDSRRRGPR
jgi:hypothetical protein